MRYFFILLFLLLPLTLWSKVYLEIGKPEVRKTMGILVFPIKGEGPLMKAERELLLCLKDINFLVLKNTEFQGIESLDETLFDEEDYMALGIDLILSGNLTFLRERDKFVLDLKIKDTYFKKTIFETRSEGRNIYNLVHRSVDDIIEHFTGERGLFSTKFAFIGKRRGRKEVYIIDFSGRHIKRLTSDGSIKLSVRWVGRKKLIFTSYLRGQPDIFIMEIGKKPKPIFRSNAFRIGADLSPDGKKIVFTSNRDGNPEIYIFDLVSRSLKRLTRNFAIDVSPRWSPDGKYIAFVSNRSGKPQIYVMDCDGGNIRRVTYQGKYNTTPSWSPDGELIAFTGLFNGTSSICIVPSYGGEVEILGRGEAPTFSPNGKYIGFASTSRRLSIMDLKGDIIKIVTPQGIQVFSPHWSPFWF